MHTNKFIRRVLLKPSAPASPARPLSQCSSPYVLSDQNLLLIHTVQPPTRQIRSIAVRFPAEKAALDDLTKVLMPDSREATAFSIEESCLLYIGVSSRQRLLSDRNTQAHFHASSHFHKAAHERLRCLFDSSPHVPTFCCACTMKLPVL